MMRWSFEFWLKRRKCGYILALTLSSACTTKPKPEESLSQPLTQEDQKRLDEAQAEMEIGRNMAGRILKLYGTYPDQALTRYVNEVGLYMSKYSDFPERRYMFKIYNSDSVNAFACPGGYILISLGAIKVASNEAEMGHILGHEVAHVGKRHMFNALQKMSKTEMDKAAADSVLTKDLPDTVKVRKRPEPEESTIGATIARYMSGSAAGLNIIKAAKAGLSVILEKGLGADLEFEADKEGTRYAINAGYDPKALINFLCRMEVDRGRSKDYCLKGSADAVAVPQTVLDKTHPSVPDRVSNISNVLVAMKADQIVGAKGKKRFMQMKNRLNKSKKIEPETDGDAGETEIKVDKGIQESKGEGGSK